MFSRMMQMVNDNDSLHLSTHQQKELLDYAKSLPRRFAAVRSLEANESKVIARCLEAFADAQPGLGEPAEWGWESAEDDLRACLRAIAQGVLMDDPDYPEARSFAHLRATLGFYEVSAAGDLFGGLWTACRELLDPAAAEVLEPYLSRAVEAAEQPAGV
jgi:hypothetical protein